MLIRSERKQDYKAIYSLNYLAFDNRNDESELINRIRDSEGFIPELSIVAEDDGKFSVIFVE